MKRDRGNHKSSSFFFGLIFPLVKFEPNRQLSLLSTQFFPLLDVARITFDFDLFYFGFHSGLFFKSAS